MSVGWIHAWLTALLATFGTFWVGEGFGLDGPGSDWSILGLIPGFLAAVSLAVPLCRRRAGTGSSLTLR